MNPLRLFQILLILGFALNLVQSCHPGRGGIRRRGARKLKPLVYKEHFPNYSERSLASSGLNHGVVSRQSKRFRELVVNLNPDVKFRDEEGTGADRLMTQRCKEKVNTLSISVMNQWPGVHLRVIEAWDEDFQHADRSLHYEGRAVDFTTSDRDEKKNGMLARLAVDAGFDWVYYENKRYVHASCRSENTNPGKGGGCFLGSSTVITSSGERKSLSDLSVGDSVLASNGDGTFDFSPVLLFLDRDPDELRRFVTLRTESGHELTLTPSHLLYARDDSASQGVPRSPKVSQGAHSMNSIEVSGKSDFPESDFEVFYAREIDEGMHVLVLGGNGLVRPSRVVSVEASARRGVYAPLTAAGNLVVDGVLASCYALVDSQSVAHAAFAPVRWWEGARRLLLSAPAAEGDQKPKERFVGVHWYAKWLYGLGDMLLPSHLHDS